MKRAILFILGFLCVPVGAAAFSLSLDHFLQMDPNPNLQLPSYCQEGTDQNQKRFVNCSKTVAVSRILRDHIPDKGFYVSWTSLTAVPWAETMEIYEGDGDNEKRPVLMEAAGSTLPTLRGCEEAALFVMGNPAYKLRFTAYFDRMKPIEQTALDRGGMLTIRVRETDNPTDVTCEIVSAGGGQ